MDFAAELKSLKDQIRYRSRIVTPGVFKNIVISGMGGSGVVGRIFAEIYSKFPVVVVHDYHVPDFVDSNTLFIAISYSGNTEETLSACEEAEERNASIVAITSGGSLARKNCQVIRIPPGLQPRSALGYMLMPLVNTFLNPSQEDIERTHLILKEMDENHSLASKLASEIFKQERFPVVMASSPYRSVAYRWKTQFNENAKILAFSSDFPELNHNETMPLKLSYSLDRFYFIAIKPESQRIRKRVDVTQLVTERTFTAVEPIGDTLLQKLFYLIHLGDYVSYELALLRNIDPSDVSLIEELKRKLQ